MSCLNVAVRVAASFADLAGFVKASKEHKEKLDIEEGEHVLRIGMADGGGRLVQTVQCLRAGTCKFPVHK